MKYFLTIFLAYFLMKVNAEGIKDNLIKLFPAFSQSNDPRICSGIALNQDYFITTEICAAQTSIWVHVHVLTSGSTKPIPTELTHNPEFTVGWNNNIVIGKMPQSSSKIESLPISQSSTVTTADKVYTFIGFKSVEGNEIYEAEVTIQDSERCKTTKFSANKYFKFNETTEICAEIIYGDNDLSTLNYGSSVIDKTGNNVVGLLSIMENTSSKKPEKGLVVLTRLSAYCSYIANGSNFKCL